jgi:hypothetical protein
MKFLIKIASLVACLTPLPLAAETVRYGFLNVVNLIPSATACEINLAGKNLVSDGLKPAVETGWFMVPVGSQTLSIQHPDHKKFVSNISVAEGASHLIVIYLQAGGQLQSDGKPSRPVIRLAAFPAYASTGFALKAVSMFPETNRFRFARETMELEFSKMTDAPKWTGGGFQIQHDGKLIGTVSGGRDRASYLLLLGTDHQGNCLTVLANADIQKLPPWMQEARRE